MKKSVFLFLSVCLVSLSYGQNLDVVDDATVSGKLGIGIASPVAKLDVGNGGSAIPFQTRAASGNMAARFNYNDNTPGFEFFVGHADGFNVCESGVSCNRFFIEKTTGKIGIGTNTPTGNLDLNIGNSAIPLRVRSASGNLAARFDYNDNSPGFEIFVNPADGMNICESGVACGRIFIAKTTGFIGMGTSAPSHLLHITGVGRSTSSTWATSSDRRAKQNIQTLESSLDRILKLRPVTFDWTDEYFDSIAGLKYSNTGFISQEVEEIFPEMITEVTENIGTKELNDFRLLDLGEMPAHLVKAIQELNDKIDFLTIQNENKDLKISILEAALENLNAKVDRIYEHTVND